MFLTEILSSVAAGGGNYLSQKETNRANTRAADRQMNFQQYMSDTAHEREVNDLRNAGLNANLSAGGNGSSTPSGAAPNLTAPQISMPDLFAYGVSLKQLDMQQQKIDIEAEKAGYTNEKTKAGTTKTKAETDLIPMKKELLKRGMPAAQLAGEGSEILSKAIKWLKNSATKTNQPRTEKGTLNSWDEPSNDMIQKLNNSSRIP